MTSDLNEVANRSLDLPIWSQGLFLPRRYKVPYGGRGSTKSWSVAKVLLLTAAKDVKRVLCAREIQKSIKDSVHKLLSDMIREMGLDWFYKITNNSIVGANGSEFIFAGLRTNASEIKSMEGIDICWVEEAQKVSAESWKYLIPTIRKRGSEIWVTFNPELETDPTSQRFLVKPRSDMWVVKVNHTDNPWFAGSELQAEMEYDYSVDPEAAAHVWGGEFLKRSKAQVFGGKYVVESFEPQHGWHGPLYGADFGFSQDPATLVRVWLNEDVTKLYIEHEAYGVGVPLGMSWDDPGRNLPKLFREVPDALRVVKDDEGVERIAEAQYVIRGDCSRPETINHLAAFGFNAVGCKKWPGCVEDRIEWLRGLQQIVIHPRCKHAEEEARLYSFKVDKTTGEILPELEDRHNHIWDGVGYALEPVILKTGLSVVTADAPQTSLDEELDEYEIRERMSRW